MVRGALAEAVAITYCVGVNCKGKKVKKRAKNKVFDAGEKCFFVMVFCLFLLCKYRYTLRSK
jgi:hypothetical protein